METLVTIELKRALPPLAPKELKELQLANDCYCNGDCCDLCKKVICKYFPRLFAEITQAQLDLAEVNRKLTRIREEIEKGGHTHGCESMYYLKHSGFGSCDCVRFLVLTILNESVK